MMTEEDPPKVAGNKSRKKILIVLIAWIGITLVVVGYRNQIEFNSVAKRVAVKLESRKLLFTPIPKDDEGCKGFDDQPMDETIAKYFKKKPTMTCTKTSPSFLYVTDGGSFLKIDKEKVKSLKAKVDYCKYASLRRAEKNGDFNIVVSTWSKSFTDSISLPENVDHIWGQCFKGKVVVGTSYASIVRKNATLENILDKRYKKHVAENSPKETLSVLIIGIDGTSKLNFARQMPKTKSFVLKDLGGIEMYKVNKIGLNTFPNVVPMLAGMSEPEVRKNWTDKEFFDKFDDKFLWEEARLKGYRTSVILDTTKVTSFHYLKKGWNKPTFHYYNRPVVVQSGKDQIARKAKRYCVGDVHEISLFYDYWHQLTKTFNNSRTTPYFGYSFFAHVTHDDINMASSVDEIYLQVFQKLAQQKSLNNTLILFFSDHGSRYGKFRSTFRGMLEDSNPFMFFIFPPWFKAKYPKVMANFLENQHRVMSNFDVHATLKDILNFKGDNITTRPLPSNTSRSVSLFQKLPKQRTCEEAGIPIKFCNCRNFSSVGITPEITEKVSKQLLKEIIAKTKTVRTQCVALTLNATVSLMAIFTTSSTHDYYQASIKTSPGGGVFEAILKSHKKEKGMALDGAVARTNMYRGQADCITDARMRPFCYCRNLL